MANMLAFAPHQQRRDFDFRVVGQVIPIAAYTEEQARDWNNFTWFILRYINLNGVRQNTTHAQKAALNEYVLEIRHFMHRNHGPVRHHAIPTSLFVDRKKRATDFRVRVTHPEHVELHRLLAFGMVHHQGLYGIYRKMSGQPDWMSHLSELGGRATVLSHGPQLSNGGRIGGLATVLSHGPQLSNCGIIGGRARWLGGERFPPMTEDAVTLLDRLYSTDTADRVTAHNAHNCNVHRRSHYFIRMSPRVNEVFYYASFKCEDCRRFCYRCNIRNHAVFRNNFPAGFF